jgi:hypothetical protein
VISADGPEELVVEELRALVHEVFVAEEESARAEEVFLECPEDVETRINNANEVFFFRRQRVYDGGSLTMRG